MTFLVLCITFLKGRLHCEQCTWVLESAQFKPLTSKHNSSPPTHFQIFSKQQKVCSWNLAETEITFQESQRFFWFFWTVNAISCWFWLNRWKGGRSYGLWRHTAKHLWWSNWDWRQCMWVGFRPEVYTFGNRGFKTATLIKRTWESKSSAVNRSTVVLFLQTMQRSAAADTGMKISSAENPGDSEETLSCPG